MSIWTTYFRVYITHFAPYAVRIGISKKTYSYEQREYFSDELTKIFGVYTAQEALALCVLPSQTLQHDRAKLHSLILKLDPSTQHFIAMAVH